MSEKMKKNIIVSILVTLFIIICVLAVEYFIRIDATTLFQWVSNNKIAFIFNFLIIGSVAGILFALTNRFLISSLLTVITVFSLVTVNIYKFKFLGEYLYPWDLLLYKNIINLLPNIYESINWFVLISFTVGALVIFVGTIVAYKKVDRKKLFRFSTKSRIILVLISITLLSSFIFYRSIQPVRYFLGNIAHVYNQPWNQQKNYANNGFLLSFLFNTQSAIIFPPKGYSKGKIDDIIAKYSIDSEVTDQVQPNIIMVMNESFWDPTVMEELEFSKDPMPTVREHQTGWVLSPMFGGRTSNVEFEVLTGFSNNFLPVGSIAYQQYISDALPSLPNYLSTLGYKNIAIHPYAGWFWNRNTVYPLLGFDTFIAIDDFVDPVYKGPYVSDAQVSQSIIQETENSEAPVFIYAITMQNHTNYSKDRYEHHNVTIEGPITDEINDMLTTYTQGIVDADEALAQLFAYYGESPEPTVIVFFGDHLPSMGNNYELYRQAGFTPEGIGEDAWTLEDYQKMRSTPLVVWNNFGHETNSLNRVSTSFLGDVTLEAAGIKQPSFHNFLKNFRSEMPGFTREIKITDDETLHKEAPDEYKQLVEDYQLLQYDILFGKRYSEKFFMK